MKFSTVALSVAALATSAVAQLTILSPGGPDLWWVAGSDNVISWTCHSSPYTQYTVLIANSNPTIQTSPLAFIPQQSNSDCSKLVTSDQVNPQVGTGYIIQLANIFNETDIYAESQPFEVKSLGSPYPATSATPTPSSTGTAAGNATSTGASSSATGAASGSGNGAAGMTIPTGLGLAALAALGAMFA